MIHDAVSGLGCRVREGRGGQAPSILIHDAVSDLGKEVAHACSPDDPVHACRSQECSPPHLG